MMHVRSGIICGLLITSILPGAGSLRAAEQGERRGNLTIVVTDLFGEHISAAIAVVPLEQKDQLKDQQKARSGGRLQGLAYGLYKVAASATGFVTREKIVGVYSPEAYAVLSLRLGAISPQPYRVLRGLVVGTEARSAKEDLFYVKVLPVFGHGDSTARINSTGAFELVEFEPGLNMLLVIEGARVLHTQMLSLIKDLETIEIMLPSERQ